MYKTTKISVQELVARMRMMKPGEEIGLCGTEDGEYSYGIRCLPGSMFDNGMCWLADYYGGGSTMAFSETEDEFMDDSDRLLENVWDWLAGCGLLIDGGGHLYVQRKDGALPETKWEFKATEVKPKNRLVCVKFDLKRPYHTYVSVPYNATDSEIQSITKTALMKLTCDDFDQHVISTAMGLDPLVADEDFAWMEIDGDCNLSNADTTDLPTGTIGR